MVKGSPYLHRIDHIYRAKAFHNRKVNFSAKMQNATLSGYNNPAVVSAVQQIHKGLSRQHFQNDGKQQQHGKTFSQPQTLIVDETKQYMDGLVDDDTDDEAMKDDKNLDLQQGHQDGLKKPGKKTRGRVKIKMEFIQNKLRRYTTFSKRKTGIMKKAYELSTLTGTQVMLLVASETGHVYTFATRKLQPMITSESGKALIQTCLNSPDPTPQVIPQATVQQAQITAINPPTIIQHQSPSTQITLPNTQPSDQRMSQTGYQEPDLQYASTEEELKGNQSAQQNLSNATTFPVTYITNSNGQAVQQTKQIPVAVQQSEGITTIFSPSSTSAVINTTQPPQILSGQLQLHRIHPQNIILTGNSPTIQSTNHILLNTPSGQQSSIMMSTDNSQVTVSDRQQQQQENVLLVQNSELSSAPSLQMVYSANGGGVIYAPHGTTMKRQGDNNSVSMQHTPVIQTPLNQDDQRVVDGSNGTIIVRHSQTGLK